MDGEKEISTGQIRSEESDVMEGLYSTDSAIRPSDQNSENDECLTGLDKEITVNHGEETGLGLRKKFMTDKGKQYELDRLKEARISALRQVTREINKLKPLLQDFNNFEFVSSENEVLNSLVAKLHDAHDQYLNSLTNTDETNTATEWFEAHDHDIFKFKQILCDYLSRAKCVIYEMKSFASKGSCHSSKKSKRSQRSNTSSVSSKSRLFEARAKVAELEVEAKFLKETQALKMASEELKLRKVLAQAKKAEQIYEQASNDDLSPLHAASILGTNISNFSCNPPVSTNISSTAFQGIVSEISTSHTNTGYMSQNSTSIANTSPTARQGLVNGPTSGSTVVSSLPPPITSLSTDMIYSSSSQTNAPEIGGQDNNFSHPRQYPIASSEEFVPTYSHYARDSTYQELINIQRKQTELSQTIVSQQARSLLPTHKPPIFTGEALEFPAFWTAFESLIESKVEDPVERLYFLGQYTTGKAKEVIKGCLQRRSNDAYDEAKRLLRRRFGDSFTIASAHIKKLSSWPQIKPNEGSTLRNFAIALEQAHSAMKGMSHMQDLNTAQVLRKLWEKLPRHLRSKWTERNSKSKSTNGRMANFQEFSQFVCEQAELATDPVFSEEIEKIPLEDKDKAKSKFPGRVRGFGTKMGKEVTTCSLCKKTHDLNDCEQFLKKPLSDRRDFVKENKLCYGCFSKQHIARNCKERQSCKICNKNHPTSLHDDNWVSKAKIKNEKDPHPENPQLTNNRTAICNITEAGDIPVNMGIIPVWLSHKDNPSNKEKVYALLDNASGGTFVRQDLVQRLNIQGSATNLVLTTMHGSESVSTQAINGLIVTNLTKEDVSIELPRTYTRQIIPADRSEIPRPEMVREIPHLKQVSEEMPPFMDDADVGLLIGLNCPSVLRPREIVYGKETEPYAIRSLLGWYINGPAYDSENNNLHCNRIQLGKIAPKAAKGYVISQRTIKEQITPQTVKQMFEMDFSEIEKGTAMSREDARFYQIVESGIVHLEDQHYEMPLPLKDQNIKLPNNYVQAENRLNSLRKRLMADDKYREDYCKFMSEIISEGYARKVDADIEATDGRIWYLPHHGVYHAQKPEKVRVVFDCSARYEGKSLNDNLLQGPDLTSNLIGVLTRFRQEKFAFMADIEKMFFQVRVKREDQNLLRFLWWPEGDMEKKAEEYCMTVHLFGAGSSPACANFALRRTADDNESEYGIAVADTLRKNFYVDDVLKSTQTEDEAVNLSRRVKEVCAKGGFNLTKFVGSTEGIIKSIPQELRAENVKNLTLGQDKLPIERALGVHWCIESDVFKFRIHLKDNPCTRRGILSTVSSIYDPLGFIAPVILVGKQILQEICHTSSWDEPVDDATRNKWEKWRSELYLLEKLDVPRSFKPKKFGKIVSAQLHNMSDASTVGYGQCSYLRLMDEDGKVHVSFVMGKARVTPRKTVSIPRLELSAATMSVKVAHTLKEELNYKEIEDHYWTDSKVVLGFISNESRRFHTYVANRVQTIQDHSDPSQWHYVETSSNPADEGSRGMSAKEFIEKAKWIEGPKFLRESEAEWRRKEESDESSCLPLPEKKGIRVNVDVVKARSGNILDRLQRFSNWQKAKIAVALCLKYKEILKDRIRSRTLSQANQTYTRKKAKTDVATNAAVQLRVEDLERAELVIVKQIQQDAFSSELKTLQEIQSKPSYGSRESDKERKAALKKTSSLHSLDPFVDEQGVIRVGGRIRKASLSSSLMNPVIIPKSSHVTSLIINHVHDKTHHSGRGVTLNELRCNGYWVINGNAMVRRFISKCVKCRYLRGSIGEQKMADLPKQRVEPAPPFTYCAVDYFGPWHVKRGRSLVKRYGALFTCLASRAIHIEVADTMETDAFIQALRRFISRRGPVREIRCDRGTNFIGAENEMKKAVEEIDDDKVKAELLKENIDWIKNPASASNFGGVWERQIRSIRNVMNALIREHGDHMDEEILRTFLCEAEATVNSRPLTVETLSDPLSEPPLSPSMLLTGKTRLVLPPPGEFKEEDIYCRKKWRRTQHLAQEFWQRWSKEYLQQLQTRNKWTQPRRNFMTGDVVLIQEAQSPRNKWPLARVVKTHPDDKGQVRSVTVVNANRSELERPINKLVLLVESQ